jgi:UDP:flavonoid glycosyltransferase YjiC (YdhE family)
MRVLLTTWAWPSHYTPMVPLVWALRAAGHDVRVASQPALMDTVTASGATGVPTGPDLDHDVVRAQAMRGQRLTTVPQVPPPGTSTAEWDPAAAERVQRVFAVFAAYAAAMLDDLADFADAWRPDLIVHDPTSYAGPLVAAALSVPAVRHIHGVDVTYQARHVIPGLITPLAARLGIGVPDILGEVTIDPCPPTLQTPGDVRRLLMRYVPYNGPGTLPDWLRSAPSRPRICITWGTSTTRLEGGATFLPPRVLAAITGVDAQIVLALAPHDAAAMGAVPPGVIVAPELPLHLLLPSCAAVIHQGGNSTLLTGALHGVPQLVLPQLPDQVFQASRVAQAGAGLMLRGDEVSPPAIRAALECLLASPGCRSQAARISAEMRATATPAAAVGELEALADSFSGRSHVHT